MNIWSMFDAAAGVLSAPCQLRYYIFDYNLVEPAYLTTTDIRHDLFGFMLTYGDQTY